MSETTLTVKLIGHTKLSNEFKEYIEKSVKEEINGKAISLTAVRTCYSPNKPSEIIPIEADKYFNTEATDGEGGSEADRLIRFIVRSKHTSTLEHIGFTFSIEGISRACLAQLTRHRFFNFSVQSQRYVGFASDNKSKGFDWITPQKVTEKEKAQEVFNYFMNEAQRTYDLLRELGVPSEDARAVLPNAAATNLTMTGNLRALLDFYSKRKAGRGAQKEITDLAEALKNQVVKAEPWTATFFDQV